jgi:prepilin-type processing-associated H-X9-DG protein
MTLAMSDLGRFLEKGKVYRHPKVSNVAYADGVKFMADEARAHWLISEIGAAQHSSTSPSRSFRCGKLDVFKNRQALLTCYNDNASQSHHCLEGRCVVPARSFRHALS